MFKHIQSKIINSNINYSISFNIDGVDVTLKIFEDEFDKHLSNSQAANIWIHDKILEKTKIVYRI